MILAAAFLGWMFAGGQMAITTLASRDSTRDMLYQGKVAETKQERDEQDLIVGQWYAWDNAAFLLGAALGGLLFGWLGDRSGRTKAMAASILTFTGFCGLAYFAKTPEQWMVLRFLSGLGVGGMWPNGIALVHEAWSDVSRPLLAGLIGTAANVGLTIAPFISLWGAVTPKTWRWAMLATASPLPLGLLVLALLPESPRWLAQRLMPRTTQPSSPLVEVFWPPLLPVTMIGLVLATVPLFGGWGNGNWLVNWADSASQKADSIVADSTDVPPQPNAGESNKALSDAKSANGDQSLPVTDKPKQDPSLKAWTLFSRASAARSGAWSVARLPFGSVGVGPIF